MPRPLIKRVGFSIGLALTAGLIALSAFPNGCSGLSPKPVKAQGTDCPDLVQKALEVSRQECASVGRGNACYGHVSITAQPKAGVSNFTFASQGDMASLSDISSLTLNGYSAASQQWGISYLRVKANLPDTAAGETVTILIFGQTQISDASQQPQVQALSPFLTLSPFQAYYFRSNTVDPSLCEQMPSSGIIVQTATTSPSATAQPVMFNPASLRRLSPIAAASSDSIPLIANGVMLNMSHDSSAYLDSRAGHTLSVNLISGTAKVTASGITQTATTGSQVKVPMTDDMNPKGPPAPPAMYDLQKMPGVATQYLPNPIAIAPPVDPVCAVAKSASF